MEKSLVHAGNLEGSSVNAASVLKNDDLHKTASTSVFVIKCVAVSSFIKWG